MSWQEVAPSLRGGLRSRPVQVGDLSERIETYAHQLEKFFVGKCSGAKNELDATLRKFQLKVPGNKKKQKCEALAAHLARSGIDISTFMSKK